MINSQDPIDLSKFLDKSSASPTSPPAGPAEKDKLAPSGAPGLQANLHARHSPQRRLMIILGLGFLAIIAVIIFFSGSTNRSLTLPPGTTFITTPGQPPRLNHPLKP